MVCFRTTHLESKLNTMHLKNNEFDENSTLIKMLNNRHINKTSYFPVTKPPYGLGKRIIVARPGLVVVKSGKLISYFSMGISEIKIILNNKTISYGIKVQLNILLKDVVSMVWSSFYERCFDQSKTIWRWIVQWDKFVSKAIRRENK